MKEMNSDQIELVKQYLNIETNYAVIISGKYGVGKTHFFKNFLSTKIREIPLQKNAEKKFTPIHISLFGFKNLEEIQSAIFLELYPILKNKNLKLATGIGKSLIRGITQIIGAGNIDKYITDIKPDTNNWLRHDELVICFDDLDRKSESLNISDVFGFINSLVENQGVKILIIANEQYLNNDVNYSSILKEKVIGVTIQFSPNLKDIYNEIIKTRYSSSFKLFYTFLKTNSEIIIKAIELNENNLRNLIFFLEHFKTIFYPIADQFQIDKNFNNYKEEKLNSILHFTLAVTIEYKLGYLNSANFEDVITLNNNFNSSFRSISRKDNKEKDKAPTYSETFRDKYFSDKKYYYFQSIFDYIIGKKAFQIQSLKTELNQYFIVENGKPPKQNIILDELSYFKCLNISDIKYKELTKQMLKYVDSGKFQLIEYGTVFHYATRFNNLLGFNLPTLKKRFKKGIKSGIQGYEYRRDLEFRMSVSRDTEFKDDLIEIVNYCKEINKNINDNIEKDKLTELFEILQSNPNTFINIVGDFDSQYRFKSFWLDFDFKKLIKAINKFENEEIWNLSDYFRDRYRLNIFSELYPEKDFVIRLRNDIDKPISKRKRKNLKNACLDNLSKTLLECEKNFPD